MALKLILLCGLISYASAAVKLREIFSWNVLDWAYVDEGTRVTALATGDLIPQNALPVGIERWQNKLFVSVPRWRPGIPATLNYIPLDAPYDPSPKLVPYPSWQANELGNCASGLTTVYRIKADKCNRLWVLDVGTYGYDPNVTNICPYTLNVYDLATDTRIRRYVFRPEDIVASTFIANIALDEGRNCEDTFAYFSDELGYGLIAYSWQQNRSWRFSHGYFLPDPLRGNFNINGLNFQWFTEGIFGITVSPMEPDGFRTLYFSPLTSHTEFAVSTKILRNESKVDDAYNDFRVVGDRGPNGHTTAHVMSERGVELYSLIDQNAIGCWNSDLPLKPQNTGIADKDDVGLIFPSDVKIVDENEVWVMSDRMSEFLENESGLDYSDINFRIFTAPLQTLVAGTVCQPTRRRTVTAAEVIPKAVNYYLINGLGPNQIPPIFVQGPSQTPQTVFNQQTQSAIFSQSPAPPSSQLNQLQVSPALFSQLQTSPVLFNQLQPPQLYNQQQSTEAPSRINFQSAFKGRNPSQLSSVNGRTWWTNPTNDNEYEVYEQA